jgi:hypothetical protein
MDGNSNAPQPLDWNVQSLRLTAFHTARDLPDLESWWAELAGQVPETRVARPREGLAEVMGDFAAEQLNPARLTLGSQPSRIDWLLQAQDSPPPGIPCLGPLPRVLPFFTDTMHPWLDRLPFDINRLALGVILLFPVATRQEGYSLLSRFLPLTLDPNSSDFLYRINRPAVSESLADGTQLNRLSTWSVLLVELVRLSISPGTVRADVSHQGEPALACRLELDVNTPADRTEPLPRDKYRPLLTELAAMAQSIADRGDRP